ncbi:hypothetical protein B0T18DRAFT_402524 [Schizothecium vesticola]|uniref:Uncharacterized protein n=1 Tax=Schizothecium vesticola TaxID=314040 RepID=A0AA40F5J4_9PEZI|nr:hypothetical protein B0T18DRAFT_402524 [Schizothecium vesticola]
MRTAIFSIALAAFAQLSTALPAPDASAAAPSAEKRDITHLYICDSSNFQGRCQNLEAERNRCYTLFNNWGDTVSSLGPDWGTTCTIWENNDCQGRSIGGIVSPGITNLDDAPWKFNDITSSYKCS